MKRPLIFIGHGNIIKLSMGLIFCFYMTSITAQDINNETLIFIPSGIEMYTGGDLINNGVFQNNGNFALEGNWLNQNVYQGTGVVMLQGVDQIISNNNQDMEKLVIDGGGLKTLRTKLTIKNEIDFNSGILIVNDNDTLCMGTNSKVNGGSLLSYVDGAMITQGTGYKFFPVGKNGKYHPVELLDIEGLAPSVEIEVFENLPEIKTSIPTTVFQDIYWTRKTIDGTFNNSIITLAYNVQESINLSRLVLAEGKDLTSEFLVRDNLTIQSTGDYSIINSTRGLTENVFVLGELENDPPKPYYLSTTLSPNAVNPDNRTVKVFGDNNNPTDFYFEVFNRWGLKIYETTSYATMIREGWDGKQNGTSLPSGLYPYSVKYIDSTGKSTQNKGFITIIE